MPVCDSEAYLREAIDSILSQTFTDFEFLIISEHSANAESMRIIESFRDRRIRHLKNARRLGLARSLNRGLKESKGEYIARMDADDVSMQGRLEIQLRFLDEHPDVGVVGSGSIIIDENGAVLSARSEPSSPSLTAWRLLLGDVVAHPSVMVRARIYRELGGYDPSALHAEDYELWIRATQKTGIVNLPDILIKLREHKTKVSQMHATIQRRNAAAISRRAIESLIGRKISSATHRFLYFHSSVGGKAAFDAAKTFHTMCFQYMERTDSSREDRKLIKNDAAHRSWTLALLCAGSYPFTSIRILLLILRSNPSYLPILLTGTMQRAGRRFSRCLRRELTFGGQQLESK
jgi:glycosyltransferase involved in cell wall biosynthesis